MNIDRIKNKQKELKEKNKNRNFWFPKPGPNDIRVLPHWSGDMEADFFYETGYHKGLGPEKKETVVCLKFERNEVCPLCDLISELYKSKDKENAAFAKQIRMQRRVYWNIVDLKDKEKGVQPWMTGTEVLEQVLDFCSNPKYGDITDPFKGRNITLVFTEGKDTKNGYNDYKVQPDPDRTPIENPEWLEGMINLSTFIKITPADQMLNILYGKEGGDGDSESPKSEESSTPKKTEESGPVPPPVQPTAKSCLGKFSSDDSECLACFQKVECQEKRKAKSAPVEKPVEKPAEKPAEKKPIETSEPDKPVGDKSSEIEAMLAKIRNKQKS